MKEKVRIYIIISIFLLLIFNIFIFDNKELKFSKVINLTYRDIELNKLNPYEKNPLGEKIKTVQIGEISGDIIELDLFKEVNGITDVPDGIYGVFQFQGQKYLLQYLGYDIDSIETFILEKKYINKDKSITLLGGVGSFILGYKYLFYDEGNKEWFYYQNWGVPDVFDINNDGIDEILIQFRGLHNNFPDTFVLRWTGKVFKVAGINEHLRQNINKTTDPLILSSIYRKEDNNIKIDVSIVNQEIVPVSYILELEQLIFSFFVK